MVSQGHPFITCTQFLLRDWMLIVAFVDFPTTYAKLDMDVNTRVDVWVGVGRSVGHTRNVLDLNLTLLFGF